MHASTWPAIATAQSAILRADWQLFVIVGLAVALSVWALILFSATRWRRREDDALPPQFRNNYALEIAWTLIPIVIVGVLFFHTYHAEAKVDAVSSHPDLTVNVQAYRWGWTFAYVGGPTVSGASNGPVLGGSVEAPPQLVLPLGETTRIALSSRDVNHGFWVPDFLFKRDAIPGSPSEFDLQPDKEGTFTGRCSQFCGLDHALMQFTVRVVTPAAFSRWRRETKAG